MSHNYKPNQKVRVFTVLIAVPGDDTLDENLDSIHALLESGIVTGEVVDFGYQPDKFKEVTLGPDPHESDAILEAME